MDSCRPSIVVLFDEILSGTRKIMELVSGLPMGPEGPSTVGHSYTAHTDYEKFLAYQKENKATIFSLERSYSTLA